MPLYDYECPQCGGDEEVSMPLDSTWMPLCICCRTKMKRVILQAPALYIPYNMQAAPENKKQQARIPINIIDEKPDGSCRVTRIGSKQDIENE